MPKIFESPDGGKTIKEREANSPVVVDKNVESVRDMLYNRMTTGYSKYGVTTERTDVDLLGWLQHLQEELLDASVYIERLKNEVKQ